MNTRPFIIGIALLASPGAWVQAGSVGTAFTYQGWLTESGVVYDGNAEFKPTLWDAASGGTQVAANSPASLVVGVTNGLFLLPLDFGASFPGAARWLQLEVRTTIGSFTRLSPRQALLPTPYALYAPNAGLATTASSATSAITAGNFTAPLAGEVTGPQTATVVNRVGGQTAANVASGVGAANAATSANTPNTIVKRDGSGGFNAGTVTAVKLAGNGSGLTGLNASALTSGMVSEARLSSNVALLNANLIFGGSNTFKGVLRATNVNNGFNGTLTGSVVGNVTGRVSGSAGSFTGSLAGDVRGTQSATVVAGVGGQTAANVASGVSAANAATSANTPNTMVKRDALGSFSAAKIFLDELHWGSAPSSLIADQGGSIELGDSTKSGATPYLDFHYGVGTNQDYNIRLMNDGDGSLRCEGSLSVSGNLSLPGTTASAGVLYAGGSRLLHCYGTANVFAGGDAGNLNLTGDFNTGIGVRALQRITTGSQNTALGSLALYNNTNGLLNTAVGYWALAKCTSGQGNVALGEHAGEEIHQGSYNIHIGVPGSASDDRMIRIGQQGRQTATVIAGIYESRVLGRAVYVDKYGQLGSTTSSRRFKEDIHDMGEASDVLLALRPVTFHYKADLDPSATPQFGLVAEEVDHVAPNLVERDQEGEPLLVRYEAVNAMLLNEFLKEHRKIEAQNARIQALEQSVAELKAIVEKLIDK